LEYPTTTKWNKIYLFGTDSLGRDLLVRVMYGAQISLLVAFIATIANLFIGVVYGSISGYEGGSVDNIMMRIVDIINSVPLVLYVILLMVWFRDGGLWNIIIALGSVYWVSMARLVRGQMLSLKEQEFVLAARVMGVSKRRIIFRHLIPNAMGPIIVSVAMMIPSAVFTEAFLSFIGLGVSAPVASWGTLANNALSGLTTYPYQLFFPALAIAFTMLAFNFIGDGLRDALDPRLRKG
ncbi:MAG: ABC transporter permease, partial [Tissierellia bacterium]|nr:ABC transporter permease [Tissierellia bacterium]